MEINNISVTLKEGDQVIINLPNGQQVSFGFGGDGQVPANAPWMIISDNNGDSAFEITADAKVEQYELL